MKNGTKVCIIKDLYFTDSQESKTSNTYLFNFHAHLDASNLNKFTFYYVFQQNSKTSSVMTIAIDWKYRHGRYFMLYIHGSKSQIKISTNPLFNESHLNLIFQTML